MGVGILMARVRVIGVWGVNKVKGFGQRLMGLEFWFKVIWAKGLIRVWVLGYWVCLGICAVLGD